MRFRFPLVCCLECSNVWFNDLHHLRSQLQQQPLNKAPSPRTTVSWDSPRYPGPAEISATGGRDSGVGAALLEGVAAAATDGSHQPQEGEKQAAISWGAIKCSGARGEVHTSSDQYPSCWPDCPVCSQPGATRCHLSHLGQRQRAQPSESLPPSSPGRHPLSTTMSDNSEDPKNVMPTERKSMWRTADERRMSDLLRVLEWMERRQRKQKEAMQKHKAKVAVPPKATGKEEKKAQNTQKRQSGKRHVLFSEQASMPTTRRDGDAVKYRRLYGVEPKGGRLSMVPGNYLKHGPGKSDLEIKDGIGVEPIRRSTSFRRQSMVDPMLPDTFFAGRRSTLLKDWVGKTPDSYERKMKSLMEKGTEPKIEMVKMLKPEEVLSCRYLRLSQNNIRTLLKLCRDAGLDVDIHPHMVEGEIDAKKGCCEEDMRACTRSMKHRRGRIEAQ
nr:PREDICTED: uncharacterized protein C16orf78 homolog isoform X2 [Rhinolophus sinicus]